MTFSKNKFWTFHFLGRLIIAAIFLIDLPVLAWTHHDWAFIPFLIFPILVLLSTSPFNKIMIDGEGIKEKGPFTNKKILWAEIQQVNIISGERSPVFIGERDMSAAGLLNRLKIGVYSIRTHHVPGPLENSRYHITFEFRDQAWALVKQKCRTV